MGFPYKNQSRLVKAYIDVFGCLYPAGLAGIYEYIFSLFGCLGGFPSLAMPVQKQTTNYAEGKSSIRASHLG